MSERISLNPGEKVLLYGGSFDPPTHAHLIVPEWVMGEIGAAQTWFILANRNPMKNQSDVSAADLRLKMLTSALKAYPEFRVLTLELERGGVSYTVDTLRELKEQYPENPFALLLGEDALQDFPRWKEPQRITELAELVTVQRPGWEGDELSAEIAGRVRKIDMPGLELSSTLVRSRITEGKPWKSLVPESVSRIILENGLYAETE